MVRILTLLALLFYAPAAFAAAACSTATATCFTEWKTSAESTSARCGNTVTRTQPCTWVWDAAGQSPFLAAREVGSLTFELTVGTTGTVEVYHCATASYANCTQLQLPATSGAWSTVTLSPSQRIGEGAWPHSFWIINALSASGTITVTGGN